MAPRHQLATGAQRKRHVTDLIEKCYEREPTENEERAINELPLGSFKDLNDKSKNGIRIWDLLYEYENGAGDLSVFEEAGKLLWEQAINEPDNSNAAYFEEQTAFTEECKMRKFLGRKFACPVKRRLKEKSKEESKQKPEKQTKEKESQNAPGDDETLVLFGAPSKNQQDQEPRILTEGDADAVMPRKKRSKKTHRNPTIRQNIHSSTHSFPQGQSQGQDLAVQGNNSTIKSAPETLSSVTLREASERYYASQGTQERPQPYAPGNFSTYICFRDG